MIFILWFSQRKKILIPLLFLLVIIISFPVFSYLSYGEVIKAYNQDNLHEIKEVNILPDKREDTSPLERRYVP